VRSELAACSRGCTVRSSTTVVQDAALCRAVASASRRSFLFILMLQSLGCVHGEASARTCYSFPSAAVCVLVLHRDKLSQGCAAERHGSICSCTTHLGTEGDTTTGPQRRALAAHPRVARALLGVRLLAAAPDLCSRLRAGCALFRRGPHHHDGEPACRRAGVKRSVADWVGACRMCFDARLGRCIRTARLFCRTVIRYRCTNPFAVDLSATLSASCSVPADSPSKDFTVSSAGAATADMLTACR